ncbi:MAG: acyltransferase family protein [Clostridia bacterium]|nr:acyltransferase family protein [Clostridia bacterium]
MEKERIVYFDYLRVFAMLAVMVLHVATQGWETADVNSFQWNVLNIYDSLVRWGVPVFVMISGALFLSKEVDVKKLYTKNIARLAVAFVVWSVFYAVYLPVSKLVLTGENTFSIKTMVSEVITGAYHMWFIPMIIGLYICVPLIKQFVLNEKLMKYYLKLSFIFAFLVPQLINILSDFTPLSTFGIIDSVEKLLSDMHLDILFGYVFYFVLGYFLSKTEFSKDKRIKIYIGGLCGFLLTVLLTALASVKAGSAVETYYLNFNVNVFLEAVAVFVLFKQMKLKNNKLNKAVTAFSQYSFGAYLVHIFVISALIVVGINTSICNAVLSVPIVSLIVIIASFIISFVLNKIPFINKWLV